MASDRLVAPNTDRRRARPSSWNLLHHGLVGAVLGFPLSIWLSGLLVAHFTGGDDDPAKYQVVMWSVPLFWTIVIGVSFLARGRLACWGWLLAANAAAAALNHLALR